MQLFKLLLQQTTEFPLGIPTPDLLSPSLKRNLRHISRDLLPTSPRGCNQLTLEFSQGAIANLDPHSILHSIQCGKQLLGVLNLTALNLSLTRPLRRCLVSTPLGTLQHPQKIQHLMIHHDPPTSLMTTSSHPFLPQSIPPMT